MNKLIQRLKSDKSGASAAEYGLLIALIAVAIITATTNLGAAIAVEFGKVTTALGG